jgi:hypothetical protein
MDIKTTHEMLAQMGVRIFSIRLSGNGTTDPTYGQYFWIHSDKTVDEWRNDLRGFYRPQNADAVFCNSNGFSEDDVFNELFSHLHNLGYIEIEDIVADSFEGRVTNEKARLVDAPDHEEQKDGFGHFGWESK